MSASEERLNAIEEFDHDHNAAAKAMSEKINVLLIEDNPGDARLVSEALAGTVARSFCLEWTDRLSSGLARLACGGIDVVLLDLGLPDSQGFATLAAIRVSAPHTPVVVLSGTDDEQLAGKVLRASAQDYLMKTHAQWPSLGRSLCYAIERMRGEEALRESEERMRLAMSAANESVWDYDPVSGAVRWNPVYAVKFGRPAGTGSTIQWWAEHIHPDDADRATSSLNHALDGRGDTWMAEYRLLRADGSWADVQDRAVIARDSSGQAVRVFGAMLDITERKRADEALQKANHQLRQLSLDLLRSQDYERRRIARELHDGTAQLLAAISINLVRVRDCALSPERQAQLLTEALDLADQCSREIRTVSYLLHPPLLDEVGLISALASYAEGFHQRTGIQIELKIPPDFGRLGRDLEMTLFRIVQEGLANVHKHSGSPSALIQLERDARQVRLAIEDRGRGLPAELNAHNPGFIRFGVGIPGIRERAEHLGGKLEIATADPGARLTVTLPLADSNEKDNNSGRR